MQTLQLLQVVDARRVVSDTDKGLLQTPRHPGGFCLSCMLVLAVPKYARTVGSIWVLCNAVRQCASLSVGAKDRRIP